MNMQVSPYAKELADARRERLTRMSTVRSVVRAETIRDTRQAPQFQITNQMMKCAVELVSPPPSMKKVREVVALHFGINESDIISHRRTLKFSKPRHIVMYLCWNLTERTAHEIAMHLGGRDHSTILYGIRVVKEKLETDAGLKADIDALEARLAA
jgi:chromosomal replication initiation ATPase DnaA